MALRLLQLLPLHCRLRIRPSAGTIVTVDSFYTEDELGSLPDPRDR